MTKVALRGLAQRKLRAFVTVLAILLGVAFIAGSYVLTDTINRSFDDIFDEAYAGHRRRGLAEHDGPGRERATCPPFSDALLDRRAARARRGGRPPAASSRSAASWTTKGDPLSNSFAPKFISSTSPEPFETLTYTEGRPPRTATEASIDESTADREDFEIGDTLRIAGQAGREGLPDHRPPAARRHVVRRRRAPPS